MTNDDQPPLSARGLAPALHVLRVRGNVRRAACDSQREMFGVPNFSNEPKVASSSPLRVPRRWLSHYLRSTEGRRACRAVAFVKEA